MIFVNSIQFRANICLLYIDSSNKIKNKYDLNHSNKQKSFVLLLYRFFKSEFNKKRKKICSSYCVIFKNLRFKYL